MTDLPTSDDGFDSIMVTVDHGLSKGIILTPCNKKGLDAEHTTRSDVQAWAYRLWQALAGPSPTSSNQGLIRAKGSGFKITRP